MAYVFQFASNIINQAAVEVGLSAVDDPFGSSDPNFIKLSKMLTTVGRDIRRRFQWSYLTKIYTFNTVAGTSLYALPNDFGSLIDQSQWNRTNRLPIGGPLSSQDWEFLKGRLSGVVYNVLFRTLQGNFQIYPDGTGTPGNYVLAYEYNSNHWVQNAAQSGYTTSGPWMPTTVYADGAYVSNGGNVWTCPTGGTSGTYGPNLQPNSTTTTDGVLTWEYVNADGLDETTAKDDVILLDMPTVVARLKERFLAASGMDTAGAVDEFETYLAQAMDEDTQAPVLNLSRPNVDDFLLGSKNIPITGYGS